MLSKRDKDQFDLMTQLMSTAGHYKSYHELLATIDDNEPCIPLIPIICSDLFTINSTLPDQSPDQPGWINWRKFDVLASRISDITRFGKIDYNIDPIPSVQKLIMTSEKWNDDNICYEIACLLEKNAEEVSSEIPKYTVTDDLWNSEGLTERDWKLLLTGAKLISFRPDRVILEEGVHNRCLYRIERGQAIVKKGNVTIAYLKKGDVFGEISILSKGKTSASVVSSGPVQVYHIPVDMVNELGLIQPHLSKHLHLGLAKKLANHLKTLNTHPGNLRETGSSGNLSETGKTGKFEKIGKTGETGILSGSGITGNSGVFSPGNTGVFSPGNTGNSRVFSPGKTEILSGSGITGNSRVFSPGNTGVFSPGNTGNSGVFSPGNTGNYSETRKPGENHQKTGNSGEPGKTGKFGKIGKTGESGILIESGNSGNSGNLSKTKKSGENDQKTRKTESCGEIPQEEEKRSLVRSISMMGNEGDLSPSTLFSLDDEKSKTTTSVRNKQKPIRFSVGRTKTTQKRIRKSTVESNPESPQEFREGDSESPRMEEEISKSKQNSRSDYEKKVLRRKTEINQKKIESLPEIPEPPVKWGGSLKFKQISIKSGLTARALPDPPVGGGSAARLLAASAPAVSKKGTRETSVRGRGKPYGPGVPWRMGQNGGNGVERGKLTSYRKSSTVTLSEDDQDAWFHNFFDLPGEVVIREFPCHLRQMAGKKVRYPGMMYISLNYLTFGAANKVGAKIREIIRFKDIGVITFNSNRQTIFVSTSPQGHESPTQAIFVFGSFLSPTTEVYKLVTDIWTRHNDANSAAVATPEFMVDTARKNREEIIHLKSNEDDWTKVEEEDWHLILKGGKHVKFQKDEVILQEGYHSRQIFQIIQGHCRIQTGNGKILGIIGPDNDGLFGEISFLEDSSAMASVIANEKTVVHVIEAYYLNILFQLYPHLAGRFYHHLASLLARRVRVIEDTTANVTATVTTTATLRSPSTANVSTTVTTTTATTLRSPSNIVFYLEHMMGTVTNRDSDDHSESTVDGSSGDD